MRQRSQCFTTVSLIAVALLAGCKKEEPAPRGTFAEGAPQKKFGFAEPLEDSNSAPPAAMRAAPVGIDVTAAPGVAFRYGYAFVLPDKAISVVQEQHAAACEKLGPTQCRITGMHYRLVEEDRVQADLQFKLAPALARQFGKDGISVVEKAEGRLVEAAIEGRDVGTAISNSQSRSEDLETQLKRVEEQLAAGGISQARKEALNAQADAMRKQLATEKQTRDEGTQELASTPMTFNYTGNTDFAFGDSPFTDAWDSTSNSFKTLFAGVLLIAGTLLPWVLLGLLLIVLWRTGPVRKLRRFIWNKRADPKPTQAAAEAYPDGIEP